MNIIETIKAKLGIENKTDIAKEIERQEYEKARIEYAKEIGKEKAKIDFDNEKKRLNDSAQKGTKAGKYGLLDSFRDYATGFNERAEKYNKQKGMFDGGLK